MQKSDEKEVALLSIRNLRDYLEGKIGKEEWESNLRRIEALISRQQEFPFFDHTLKGPHPLESTSDN